MEQKKVSLIKKRKTTFSQKETFPLLERALEEADVTDEFTGAQKRMLYNLERRLGVAAYAAKDAGITRQAHYKWMAHNPEYKKMVDTLNELLIDYAETRLLAFIKRDDYRAIMYLLQTKGKNRGYSRYWKESTDSQPHPKVVINLTNPEGAKRIEAMQHSGQKTHELRDNCDNH